MSYNITKFKLKELKEFSIRISDLYNKRSKNWHPIKHENYDGTYSFSSCESEGIVGNINGDFLNVTNIDIYGEGSGRFFSESLAGAFKKSKGVFVASCVWEGGDSIESLKVENGLITWKEIEI